jgi:hypothetical protein
MVRKEEGFFEKHIEKVILLVVCAISAFILFYYIILGPCKVTYDGKKFSPAQIDEYILKKAETVKEALNKPTVPAASYQSRAADFIRKMSPQPLYGNNLYPLIPPYRQSVGPQPKYNLPEIPPIEQMQLEHIRVVAYVPRPRETITAENLYSQTTSEPNDLDLVTVEFQFDIAALCKSFNDTFAGPKIKEQWRDKTIAEPVFAAVQLQRQESAAGDADESWSDWQDVPRSRIDGYSKLLNIVENVADLPTGGLQVKIMQCKDKAVQIDIIQPDCYRIASANEEWFPPSLHTKYTTILESELRKQKREAREAEADRKNTPTPPVRGPMGAGAGPGARGATGRPALPPTTQTSIDTAVFNQLYKDFDKTVITDKTDLSKMTEPLTVWAFDDTIQPTKKYRYRVRLGVFNPIAGTDKFSDNNDLLKNKVVLWTNFVESETVVQVPAKLYFFAKSIEELKKRVTVLVGRYRLGYWYTKDFKVVPGETIGQKIEKSSEDTDMAALQSPKRIDYATGVVLLDAVQKTEWTGAGNLYSLNFYEILYSSDGAEIQRMPIGDKFWPDELRQNFSVVKAGESLTKEPLRPWDEGKDKKQKITEVRPPVKTNIPGAQGMDPELLKLLQKRGGGGQN